MSDGIKRMLIVRGCDSPDDLQALGLPMAHRYAEADMVVLIGADGTGLVTKGHGNEIWLAEFYDATGAAGATVPSDGDRDRAGSELDKSSA